MNSGMHLLKSHNALLLDVRSYAEYCTGHLADAVLVPTQLPPLSNRECKNLRGQLIYLLKTVPKDRPVVVYCKKGVRARIAKEILTGLGYKQVVVLGGVETTPLSKLFTKKNKTEWPICNCQGN